MNLGIVNVGPDGMERHTTLNFFLATAHFHTTQTAGDFNPDGQPNRSDAFGTILAECRRALAEDDSGAIVLGCAGMADLCERLRAELGVPVIDGVVAATVAAEGLVRAHLGTSKLGDYAPPLAKPWSGALASFAP